MAPDDNLVISGAVDEEGGVLDSFLLFKLTELDMGSTFGRTSSPNFVNRTPHCVTNFTRDGLLLAVTNLGTLASDLVYIDYQVRYCTLAMHGPADGFMVDHAEDEIPDEADKYLTVSSVPARDTLYYPISFDNVRGGIRNIYFRARVTSLWEEKLPPEQWNFAGDRMITEAHLKLP